jgi:uncharacterized protein (DUF1810 family)
VSVALGEETMVTDASDPHGLRRFEVAQQRNFDAALAELQRGRKRTHWMWYVFPQIAGLGASEMSRRYAIRSAAEAEAYLRHPVLGPRLVECFEATLAVEGQSAQEIFGSPDDQKLRSCATLFASVSRPGSLYEHVLAKYFGGEPDGSTLELLRTARSDAQARQGASASSE